MPQQPRQGSDQQQTKSAGPEKEKTFTTFTAAQAAAYAANRNDKYPAALYARIFAYVRSREASDTSHVDGDADVLEQAAREPLELLLDVGTGPGKAVFEMLPYFKRAVGVDPGDKMIEIARRDAQTRGVDEARVRFEVCGAESCADALAEAEVGKVDLITCAMAAHWFDMEAFYTSAAKALRPGGTLAMFTCTSGYVHPSDPKRKEIQAILSNLEDNILGPYEAPGNRISRDAYVNLALPWTLPAPNATFSQASFVRKDWDLNGIPSAPSLPDGTPGPFLFSEARRPEEMLSLIHI